MSGRAAPGDRRRALAGRTRVLARTLALSVRADRRVALLIALIVAAQAGSVVGVALAQRWVVDNTGLGTSVALVVVALLGAAAYAVNAAGNRIQVNLRGDLSERVDLLLNQEILADTARIPSLEHLERPEFLDRLAILRRGTEDLAAACWSATETAASVLSLGLSLWLLAAVHPLLILLALLSVPPLLFARRSQRILRETRDATIARVRHEQRLHELCVRPEEAKEVRIAGNGPELSRRADALWSEVTRAEAAARLRGARWQFAGWACFAVGFLVAVAVVAHLADTGRASLGDIVLVTMLATRLRWQISQTVFGLNRVAESGHVADQYLWLRDYADRHRGGGAEAPWRIERGIELRGVSFRYPGATGETLRGIDLRLPAGSTVGLVGVNGAGKTTLVKLLTRMYEPTGGSIAVDGQPLSTVAAGAWPARASGAFQDFAKFQFRCGETVGVGDLPRLEDPAALRWAVDRAGAAGTVDSLPDGVRTQLGQVFDGVELSHGQWQKLALARSLMPRGPLLFVLDEPTAALDPQAEHELFEDFLAQAREYGARHGTVTVLVSHRFATVRGADHIVVLADGAVLEQGTHAELMRAGGHYAELYATQARGYA